MKKQNRNLAAKQSARDHRKRIAEKLKKTQQRQGAFKVEKEAISKAEEIPSVAVEVLQDDSNIIVKEVEANISSTEIPTEQNSKETKAELKRQRDEKRQENNARDIERLISLQKQTNSSLQKLISVIAKNSAALRKELIEQGKKKARKEADEVKKDTVEKKTESKTSSTEKSSEKVDASKEKLEKIVKESKEEKISKTSDRFSLVKDSIERGIDDAVADKTRTKLENFFRNRISNFRTRDTELNKQKEPNIEVQDPKQEETTLKERLQRRGANQG